MLDGKSKPNYSNNMYQIAREQLKDIKKKSHPIITTPYFNVQCYQNGNTKVTFTRFDILAKLNKYGSSGQLPDSMKKRYKSDHFKD